MASQRVDRTAPALAARVRSLSLGRSAQAVAQLARPNTVVARVGQWIIRLIAAAGLVGLVLPIGLAVVNVGRSRGWAGAIIFAAIVVLALGTTVIRWHGDQLLSLVFGLGLLTSSAALAVWVFVDGDFGDERSAAGMATLYFLASLGCAVLLVVGGTVGRAGWAAWIGVAAFVCGVIVLGFGLAHWWAMVLLVIAAASTALIFGSIVVVLMRLGAAIEGIGESAG